jgi:hypothetical protein
MMTWTMKSRSDYHLAQHRQRPELDDARDQLEARKDRTAPRQGAVRAADPRLADIIASVTGIKMAADFPTEGGVS